MSLTWFSLELNVFTGVITMNNEQLNVSLASLTHTKTEPIKKLYKNKIRIWVLKILLDPEYHRKVGKLIQFGEAAYYVDYLGLYVSPGEDIEDAFDLLRINSLLKELAPSNKEVSGIISENINHLSSILSLSIVEKDVLEFLLLLKLVPELKEATSLIGDKLTRGDFIDALAVILDSSKETIALVIRPGAKLFNSGLVRLPNLVCELNDKVEFRASLLDAMTASHGNTQEFLDIFVNRAGPVKLTPNDFDGYGGSYSLLFSYIKTAIIKPAIGQNVLIYGVPGAGKTEMVRTLCKDVDAELFEISPKGPYGEAIQIDACLSSLLLSQSLLKENNNAVLLFDDVDGIFPGSDTPFQTGLLASNEKKSWFNNLLETNQVPVIWVANNIGHLNQCYLRRFDIILKIEPTDADLQSSLIKTVCIRNDMDATSWVDKVPHNSHLTPGIVEKTLKAMPNSGLNSFEAADLFQKTANSFFEPMGLPKFQIHKKGTFDGLTYNVDLLNVNVDIDSLLDGLKQNGSGRFLCYGEPGTGKTAFAKYLSEMLEKPLIKVQLSEVLNKYIGETEKAISKAFQQAEKESAILLIDEIDSLLSSRERAHHTWEVSQVNELLVQIEKYEGILLGCTNHKTALDAASERRFDLKIKFKHLEAISTWSLFEKVLNQHEIELGDDKSSVKKRVLELESITLGDFNMILRGLRFAKEGVSALGLLIGLEAEVKSRGYHRRRGIGFVNSETIN